MIEGAAQELRKPSSSSHSKFAARSCARNDSDPKELAAQVGKPKRECPHGCQPEHSEIADRIAGDRIEAALYTPNKVDAEQSGQRVER